MRSTRTVVQGPGGYTTNWVESYSENSYRSSSQPDRGYVENGGDDGGSRRYDDGGRRYDDGGRRCDDLSWRYADGGGDGGGSRRYNNGGQRYADDGGGRRYDDGGGRRNDGGGGRRYDDGSRRNDGGGRQYADDGGDRGGGGRRYQSGSSSGHGGSEPSRPTGPPVKPEGKTYDEIKAQCLRENRLFEDPDFPAVDSSVFPSKLPRQPLEWRRPGVRNFSTIRLDLWSTVINNFREPP